MASIESIPKASFSLKSNDISTSDVFGDYPVTNNVGTINAARTEITWYSVNFENILNGLYDKYDMFNLRLNSVSYTNQAAFGVAAFDRLTYFQVNDLPWENNSYSTTRKCNTNSTVLGAVNFAQGAANTIAFDNSFIATFRKQKTANITIQLLTLDGNPPALNAATQFPRISFYFDIIPVA
jgi:hypothetical protein